MERFAQAINEWGWILFSLALIAAFVIPSVWKERKYNRSPEYESRARLLSRRTGFDQSGKNVYEVYYGTFETDFGQVVEVRMPRDTYYLIPEGARGLLTWKGGKMEGFRADEEERK